VHQSFGYIFSYLKVGVVGLTEVRRGRIWDPDGPFVCTNQALVLARDRFRFTTLILNDKRRRKKKAPNAAPFPLEDYKQLQCAGAGAGHGVNGAVPPFTVSTVESGKL
jgi:hypothetical protein